MRMMKSARSENAERGKRRCANNAIAILIRKDRYIATPPKRGSGVWCIWRWSGGDTQPRAVAKARTLLVRTNENSNDDPKIPRYKSVNQSLRSQKLVATTTLT